VADGVSPPERKRGRVTLIGAGPGDADLLTVRGARRLAAAELVLYDALSSDAMRAYAPRARWFYVGKRACRQSIGQDAINGILIREAMRGREVVRLKCGDPFVLGRGGEELLALAQAGITCEVVPGVSTAVGGPALAGIPVTHRGMAAGFAVVSGHHEATYLPLLAALPRQGMTVVVLMGLGQRARIARALDELGWDAATPAAVVIGAATAAAWTWTGRLGELGGVALPAPSAGEPAAPGLLVIGQVVTVAAEVEALRRGADVAAVATAHTTGNEAEDEESTAAGEAETEAAP